MWRTRLMCRIFGHADFPVWADEGWTWQCLDCGRHQALAHFPQPTGTPPQV